MLSSSSSISTGTGLHLAGVEVERRKIWSLIRSRELNLILLHLVTFEYKVSTQVTIILLFFFMKCDFLLHSSSQNVGITVRRAKAKFVTRSGSSVKFIWRKTMARRIHYICRATQKGSLSQDFESLLTRTFFVTYLLPRLVSFCAFVFVWPSLDFFPSLKSLTLILKG